MANGASLVAGQPSAFCVVPGPGMLNAGAALTSGYWSNAARAGDHRRDRHRSARARVRRAARARRPARDPRPAHQARRAARRRRRRRPSSCRRRSTRSCSGRPRPVSVEVPVDRWRAAGTGHAAHAAWPSQPARRRRRRRARRARRSERAERPLIVVGGGAQDAGDAIAGAGRAAPGADHHAPHGSRRDPHRPPAVRPPRRRSRAVEVGRPRDRHRHAGWSGR